MLKNPDPGFFLAVVLALIFISGGQLFAQDDPNEEVDTSQHVDESEENYRQRMELRDRRYQEQSRVNTTYTSQAGEGKLDQLPPESREHIKEQLTDMIIENRQWQPGDDLTDYPYEPSAAAQTDPALHKLEREAWAEQLEKYQEREAAAYANASANADGQKDSSESGEGQGDPGSKSASASGKESASDSPGKESKEKTSEAYVEQSPASQEVSTAGVSESALSFLQGHGGRAAVGSQTPGSQNGGQSTTPQEPPAQGSAGNPAAEAAGAESAASATVAAAIPGTVEISDLAMLQGMNTATDSTTDASSPSPNSSASTEATSQQDGDKSSEQDEEAEIIAEDLAGTLAIDDLTNFDAAMPQAAGAQTTSATDSATEQADPAEIVEPGTLRIAELEKLEGN